MKNKTKNSAAVILGKKSWEVRSKNKSKEEIKNDMKKVWEKSLEVRKERSLTKIK